MTTTPQEPQEPDEPQRPDSDEPPQRPQPPREPDLPRYGEPVEPPGPVDPDGPHHPDHPGHPGDPHDPHDPHDPDMPDDPGLPGFPGTDDGGFDGRAERPRADTGTNAYAESVNGASLTGEPEPSHGADRSGARYGEGELGSQFGDRQPPAQPGGPFGHVPGAAPRSRPDEPAFGAGAGRSGGRPGDTGAEDLPGRGNPRLGGQPGWGSPAGEGAYARSDPGEPPQDAPPPGDRPQSGQQPPYGSGQGQYGQQPGYPPPPPGYGINDPYGVPPGLPAGMPPFASWWQRVGAYLLDNVLVGLALGLIFGWTDNWAVNLITELVALAWALYNAYLGGATGQSYGKRAVNIRLARLVDGQPVGVGLGLLRWFLDWFFIVLCLIPGLLNFLWPLWDEKCQTWCDKIASSVVVRAEPPR